MSTMSTRGKKPATQTFHRAYYFDYRKKEQDPVIDSIRTMMAETGLSRQEIEERGGPAASTIKNWEDAKVFCPQFRTIAAAGRAMGYTMGWHPTKHKMNGGQWTAKAAPILAGKYLRG